MADLANDDQRVGIKIVRKALQSPARRIAENSWTASSRSSFSSIPLVQLFSWNCVDEVRHQNLLTKSHRRAGDKRDASSGRVPSA